MCVWSARVRVCVFANWMSELICYRNEVKADRRPSGGPKQQDRKQGYLWRQHNVLSNKGMCTDFLHWVFVKYFVFFFIFKLLQYECTFIKKKTCFSLLILFTEETRTSLSVCIKYLLMKCQFHSLERFSLLINSTHPSLSELPPMDPSSISPLQSLCEGAWQQTHRRPATRMKSGRVAWACDKEGG